MSETKIASERLLDAAERLFAERGIRATSLRDITALANVNTAGVNYYYRTKDALVQAVYERCFQPLNEQRLELLASILQEAGDGALTLDRVLYAFFEPMTRAWRTNRNYVLLLGRLQAEPDPALGAFIRDLYTKELIPSFLAAARRAAPDIAEDDIFFWIHFSFGGTVYALLNSQDVRRMHAGQALLDCPDLFLERLVRFAMSGLSAFRRPEPANAGRGAR